MRIDQSGIPNIKVKNIGTRKNYIGMVDGVVKLPCWTGYFLAEADIYSKAEKVITAGEVGLSIDHYKEADGSFHISEEQVAAYFHLVQHQENIKQVIIERLRLDFPRLLEEEYQYFDHEEGGFPNPAELTPGFDFIRYIGPRSLNILEQAKDGIAYIQWHFNCRWDPEHGFHMTTHKDRVIEISSDPDIANVHKDNGTYEQYEADFQNMVFAPPKKKKKWWQWW